MMALCNRNRLTQRLCSEYPIVQGPLGGLSSQRWIAAVPNFRGLGSCGAHGGEPQAIQDVIAEIRPCCTHWCKTFLKSRGRSLSALHDGPASLSGACVYPHPKAHASGKEAGPPTERA